MVYTAPSFHDATDIDSLKLLLEKHIEKTFGWSDKYGRNPFHITSFTEWLSKVDSNNIPTAIMSLLMYNLVRWGHEPKNQIF